jgi:hypothetical protein
MMQSAIVPFALLFELYFTMYIIYIPAVYFIYAPHQSVSAHAFLILFFVRAAFLCVRWENVMVSDEKSHVRNWVRPQI